MIPNIGAMEIAIVLIIALVVFGPKRLPELGKSLGKGLSGFKDGMSGIGQDEEDETTPRVSTNSSSVASPEPVVSEVTEDGSQASAGTGRSDT